MEPFTVEGVPALWPKMFTAAAGKTKLANDLLDAAKVLADAATDLLPSEVDGVKVTGEPSVRVQVLASDTGGFARFMLDVYVTR